MAEHDDRGPDPGPQEPIGISNRRPAPRVYGGAMVYDVLEDLFRRDEPRVYFARVGRQDLWLLKVR
ncbi:MAG TPA: hypothetical protein VI933_04440 [archaeon]|nr:hypothetical protein [archaeon]